MPSIVSVNRRRAVHVGDMAANEAANQALRATKTWGKRYAGTDVFKEFKRTMGTTETYYSKNLKENFTSEQLSAEIIKALSACAGANDGGCIIISVPAKFDATQKTATVNAAHLAGFQYVELIQEPIAAAITYGVTSGQSDGANTHSRAIAKTVIWLKVVGCKPSAKHSAIACIGILATQSLHTLSKTSLTMCRIGHQPLSHSQGHHRIIGKATTSR